ncbi:MAG: 8-oxo-dGTP diphosphatase MutT [Pseudomonadota bacterium]
MRSIRVAAGILIRGRDEVLIAERLDGPFTGLWEFPGGKIDPGESALAALVRELNEELGITTLSAEPFMALEHSYPDRTVSLEFFLVREWRDEPRGLDGQRLQWQAIGNIGEEQLLPANGPVIRALRELPG